MDILTTITAITAAVLVFLLGTIVEGKTQIAAIVLSVLLYFVLTDKSLFAIYAQLPMEINSVIRILVYSSFLAPLYLLPKLAFEKISKK